MSVEQWLELINELPLADTHEHLMEEDSRDEASSHWGLQDFSVFFAAYPESDLQSAGMSKADTDLLLGTKTETAKKWQLVKPYWEYIKNTGYGKVIRISIKEMFDEDDLHDGNWESLSSQIAEQIKPGWYHRIVKDIAKIDHLHVNTLQDVSFAETLYPEYMLQDLSILQLSVDLNIKGLEQRHDFSVSKFSDLQELIELIFHNFGPRAVAVKNQGAYLRRLDFEDVPKEEAERCFEKYAATNFELRGPERKPLEDWLFHQCVNKATEYQLPVKLHTGYYAGVAGMPLHRVGANPGDCAELCMKHPDARFVFMHSMYPYQDELISLCKHFPNAFPDMCWTWIINPAASVRFVCEAMMAVPVNKIFLFGGDHCQAELIPGHARIARNGLALALECLVSDGWFSTQDAEYAARRLTLENARELYDIARCCANNNARKRGHPIHEKPAV